MTIHPVEENDISLFAQANFRNQQVTFGIKRKDRRSHIYTIGKTGTGKSTLLETLILQDIRAGHGLALLDPHGDLVEKVAIQISEECKDRLIYFDLSSSANPLGLNPLESVSPAKRPLAASGLLEVFKKIWPDFWGPRLEHILRNTLLALLDQPQSTLADIPRLLDDRMFRMKVAKAVTNDQVREFWLREYENYPARFRTEAIAPIQNKVGAFLANPYLNKILTQPKNAFYMRRIMDEGKILLVNLAKGIIGEDTATLLGSLLVNRAGLAALSRADTPEARRRDFYLYLDEFQNFTTLSLANMLSELRKYRVSLTLSHQYLSQLDPKLRDAILGNVGTAIVFRIGGTDAEILSKEFYPEFSLNDLTSLPDYHIYLKLMIDGVISRPFSAITLAPKKTDA
jgi:hypothetical protein